MEQKVKRTKTADQALRSLMNLCARGERSTADARRLMRKWGVAEEEAAKVLARLVAERFIDDARYAEAFVRDKLNLSGWGVYKIGATLRAKGLSADVVAAALEQSSSSDMEARLEALIRRKAPSVKAKNAFERRTKLMRYALSQGYDYEMARSCVESVVDDNEE